MFVQPLTPNEFLKKHCKVESLEEKVARLEATVEKQSALIEKVSTQVQSAQPAPRVVANE
jgi:hypothetical protein